MNNEVPTLLCINASYAQHAAVCIVSLLENNRDLCFNIVVVTTEPLGPAEGALRATVSSYTNVELTIRHMEAAPDMIVHGAHRSIDTYTRFWVAEFFSEAVTKVLYLDSDMVVVGSIAELWRTNLGDKVVGAVTIPGARVRCGPLGIPEEFGYFQAGVLLINLRKWRECHAFELLVSWLTVNGRKTLYTDDDQTALNACLYDKRLVLPYIWNVIVPFYFDHHPLGISEEERSEIRRGARIIHYNVPSKPWHYVSRHPKRDEYWKYLKLTEWRGYRPKDRNLLNWTKKHFGPCLPRPIRAYFRKWSE